MPIDTSFYNAFAPKVKSVAEYDAEADQNAFRALQKEQLGQQVDEYGRKVQAANALAQFQKGLGGMTRAQQAQAYRDRGYLDQANSLDDAETKARTGEAEIGLKTAQAKSAEAEAVNRGLEGRVKAMEYHSRFVPAIQTVEDAVSWSEALRRDGILEEAKYEPAMARLRQLWQTPEGIAQWKKEAQAGGMSTLDRLKQQLEQEKLAETVRNNKATDATSRANNAATNATSSANNAATNATTIRAAGIRAQADGVKPPSGYRYKADGTLEAIPGGPGDKTAQLRPIPPAAQKAMVENTQSLSKVETAIQLLEGNDVGGMKGDKQATGAKGYLPNQVLNRIDPQGVDARAQIADIGSLIIHDRSGAAVTASEFPRLAPFIPTEKDDNATALKKLRRFKQIYEAEQAAMGDVYNEETGYRAPQRPVQPAKAPAVSGGAKFLGFE